MQYFSLARWRKIVPALVVVMLVMLAQPLASTQAQIGGTIGYGSSVFGTISATVQSLTYSFSGSAGDLVTVEVLGLSGGLDPQARVSAPDGAALAIHDNDQYITGSRDVFFSFILPQGGAYSVVVGGMGGTTGDFLLTLSGRPSATGAELLYGVPVVASLLPASPPHYYAFTAQGCTTTLTVRDVSPGHGFPFIVRVRNEQGQLFALLRGGSALEDRVTVPANSGRYDVEVLSDAPMEEGAVELVITCADNAPPCVCEDSAAGFFGSLSRWDGRCLPCPPCDRFDEDVCPDMNITVAVRDLLRRSVRISWNPVMGADGYQLTFYALVPGGGEVLMGSIATPELAVNATLPAVVDSFRLVVTAVGGGELLCVSETIFSFAAIGPVDWGPAVACTISLRAPRETIANGLQTFFWTVVPGATSYSLRVYSLTGDLLTSGSSPAGTDNLTLDVSQAAIGPGRRFQVVVIARHEGHEWCTDIALLSRAD